MPTDLIERVRAAQSLPTLPASAMEVLRLTQAGDTSADDLADVIERDPSLAARLLQMVNSPVYGLRYKVVSIRQAVSLLGQRAVRVTALSVSLALQINTRRSDGFDYQSFWRSSLTSAVASRLLAKAARSGAADEVFVAGLLSQIGRLAAHCVDASLYRRVIETKDAHGLRLRDAEKAVLGVSGASLGQALLERWGLPDSICKAVGASRGIDRRDAEELAEETVRLVCASCVLADLFCDDIHLAQLTSAKLEAQRIARIDEATLEDVLHQIDDHVRRMATDMSLEIGETASYAALRERAAIELTRLTL